MRVLEKVLLFFSSIFFLVVIASVFNPNEKDPEMLSKAKAVEMFLQKFKVGGKELMSKKVYQFTPTGIVDIGILKESDVSIFRKILMDECYSAWVINVTANSMEAKLVVFPDEKMKAEEMDEMITQFQQDMLI